MVEAERHVDAEGLALMDEGLLDAAASARAGEHLSVCADCRARRQALARVRRQLRLLPSPAMPADVAARLDAALTTKPRAVLAPRRRGWRWGTRTAALAAAAAAVLIVVAVVVGTFRGSPPAPTDPRAGGVASSTAARPQVVPQASGRDYTPAVLARGVDALLPGPGASPSAPRADTGPATPGTAAEQALGAFPAGTARLLDPQALAGCLAALGGPAAPLAVDLARFNGRPAAIVVVPAATPGRLDVWVVGPGCSRGDPQLRYFSRVLRPAG